MAKRIPSYYLQEQERESDRNFEKHRNKRYSFERKLHKSSNLEIFEMLTNGEAPDGVSQFIHYSNNRESWKKIESHLHIFSDKKSKSDYYNFLKITKHILKVSDNFISDIGNTVSLSAITNYYDFAIRDIEDWTPKRNNVHFQMEDILSFLFAKYEVPKFLYKGFYNSSNSIRETKFDSKMIELFIHIGSGQSLKSFSGLPKLKMNKKAYHYLFTTPENLDFYRAFRRAQILSMGGDMYLFNVLMDSKLNLEATQLQDDFWSTVIQFFITHQMISEVKVKEIIDFIYDQKFTTRMRPGTGLPPHAPQPDFSMKGRTPTSLIRMSDEWHYIQQMAQRANANAVRNTRYRDDNKDLQWPRNANINGYSYQDSQTKLNYIIRELLSSQELRDDGSRMRHCVYSYSSSCYNGNCSIFSLSDTINGPLVTMEIRNYRIVQIRGKANFAPGKFEMSIIRKWAEKERLDIV